MKLILEEKYIKKMDKKEDKYGHERIVGDTEKIKSFKQSIITAPIYVRVKPTNICSHNCFFCVYESSWSGIHCEMTRQDQIPKEKIMEILSDFKKMGVKAITFSGGGEPLIYPYIEEVLQKTIDYGLDYAMITNGQSLEGRKAELLKNAYWIRVSSDSCFAETFAESRRRPKEWFNKLIENIKNFTIIKNPKCNFGINFVVHEKNFNQVYLAIKFYKELGVDYIKLTPAWNPKFYVYHEKIKDLVIEEIKKAKRDFEDEKFKVKDTYDNDFSLSSKTERAYEKCYIMQTIPVIGADSNVYFCHNKAYDDKGILGSIKNQSFKQLWFSDHAREIFKNFNPKTNCKHQCTNDKKNIEIIKKLGL
jgi:wyosine [tRNA(Phe)-imidazoG37] synthetase (radical SAM superfamily)